jgi:hypothetical protein
MAELVIGLVMLVRWFQGRAVFTERGLAPAFWTTTGKSLHTASMAPVRRPAPGRGGNGVCPRSLRFALPVRLVCWSVDSRRFSLTRFLARIIFRGDCKVQTLTVADHKRGNTYEVS